MEMVCWMLLRWSGGALTEVGESEQVAVQMVRVVVVAVGIVVVVGIVVAMVVIVVQAVGIMVHYQMPS